jgi:hypothetical protein
VAVNIIVVAGMVGIDPFCREATKVEISASIRFSSLNPELQEEQNKTARLIMKKTASFLSFSIISSHHNQQNQVLYNKKLQVLCQNLAIRYFHLLINMRKFPAQLKRDF